MHSDSIEISLEMIRILDSAYYRETYGDRRNSQSISMIGKEIYNTIIHRL